MTTSTVPTAAKRKEIVRHGPSSLVSVPTRSYLLRGSRLARKTAATAVPLHRCFAIQSTTAPTTPIAERKKFRVSWLSLYVSNYILGDFNANIAYAKIYRTVFASVLV
jgi:hypothetical protein